MPANTPLVAALEEAERDQPDFGLIRRLLLEIMQRSTRGLWTVDAGALSEIRDLVFVDSIFVQITRQVTFPVAGDEYTLPANRVFHLTAGEYVQFISRVPADAYTITNRAAFDGVNGVIRTFGREAIGRPGTIAPPNDAPPPVDLPSPLLPPVTLATGTPTTTTMPLTWVNQATDATAIEVQFKLVTATAWTVDTAALAPTATSRTVAGLAAATAYNFRVRALRGTDPSPWSNVATAGTASAGGIPISPANLTATPGITTMVLAWTDRATDETSHEVEYRLAGGASSIAITSLAVWDDAADLSSYVSPSVTLTANRPALLAIQIEGGAATPPTVTSVTGLTATWVQVDTRLYDDDGTRRGRMYVFRTMVATNQTGTVTIALSAAAQGIIGSLVECDGADITGTNGSGAIVQSATAAGVVTGSTSATAALVNFADATNDVCYAAFAWTNTNAFTAEAGFTTIHNRTQATGMSSGLATIRRTGEDVSPSATFAAAVVWGEIAVEIRRGVGATWTAITGLGANITTHTVPSLTPNTAYEFRVRNRNATGPSEYTAVVTETTLASAPPAAPTGLTQGAIAPTTIGITWTDNATDETGYVVRYVQDDESIPSANVSATSITITPANVVDYNPSTLGWNASGAPANAAILFDLGSAKTLTRAAIYLQAAGATAGYTVQHADAAAGPFTTVVTNWTPSNLGWNETTWAASGSHRYWRLLLATAGTGLVADAAWGYTWQETEIAANSVAHTITGLTASTSYKIVVLAVRTTVRGHEQRLL